MTIDSLLETVRKKGNANSKVRGSIKIEKQIYYSRWTSFAQKLELQLSSLYL